jgi:hypothetical protein
MSLNFLHIPILWEPSLLLADNSIQANCGAYRLRVEAKPKPNSITDLIFVGWLDLLAGSEEEPYKYSIDMITRRSQEQAQKALERLLVIELTVGTSSHRADSR